MHSIKEQQLDKIAQALDLTRTTFTSMPDDTPERYAATLAWQALRLTYHIMKEDRLGITEKTHYVKLYYEKLMRELDQ